MFAAYLVLFSWLVTRNRFFLASGLSKPQLLILFLLKVMSGILYGWIGVYYGELAKMVDTWAYHYESLQEYNLLKSNPGEFFTNILRNPYGDGYTRFLASENSWWNDLKANIFIKLLAVFNLASFGNYYTNVIFYSFITLFGPVALFRVMLDVFRVNRLALILGAFLVPSFLYWTSGLHKDGLIFLAIALVIYAVYVILKTGRLQFLHLFFIVTGLLMVITLRNFLIIPLLPALFAWVAASKLKAKPWLVFAGTYAVFILFFFTARYIHPRLNFPEEVAARQEAFLGLGGGSAVEVSRLQPSFSSFVRNTPASLALSTIRPYPADVNHLLSLAAATEINFLLLLALFCLIYRRSRFATSPFILFCLFLSFSVLLMIGYTVNILGAIVRYRSIVLPLLMVPVVAQANWKKIGQLFGGDITEKEI